MAKKKTKNYVKITTEPKNTKGRQVFSFFGVLFLLMVIGGFWAFPRSTALDVSSIYNKEEVEEKAKEIIELFQAENYEAIREISHEELAKAMTKKKMDEARTSFAKDWGAFASYGEIKSTEVKRMGKSSAVVQMPAKYENIEIVYTLSFDENLKLAGFGME